MGKRKWKRVKTLCSRQATRLRNWYGLQQRFNFSDEDWKKQYDEISKAINRLLLVLLSFSFFCALALGAPDRSLIANDAKIKLPFADAEISFLAFLVVAPFVLGGMFVYLHIFVGHKINLECERQSGEVNPNRYSALPFVFNLPYFWARVLSYLLFYWLVPAMMGIFTWKALPRPEAPGLLFTMSLFVAGSFFLQIRRYERMSRLVHFLLHAGVVVGLAVAIYVFSTGITPIHRFLNLRKANLAEQDLRSANLAGADLTEADLRNALLTETKFAKARLDFATLTGATAEFADFRETYLTSAHLNQANLTGADFEKCQGLTVDFRDSLLPFSKFEDADLTFADFRSSWLGLADTKGAIITAAKLDGADLTVGDPKQPRLQVSPNISMSAANSLIIMVGRQMEGDIQNISQEQIDSAHGDETTKLPPRLHMPATWAAK